MSHINDIYGSIKNGLTPIHPEGFKFAAIAFLGLWLIGAFTWHGLFWVGLVLGLYCLYFFRDPDRVTPLDEKAVISPADGLVQRIVTVVPPSGLGLGIEPVTRISVFLNIFNVHINRVPVSGTVVAAEYVKGSFFNADLDKASDENERQMLTVQTASGQKVGFMQIAGFVARRIKCNIVLNQHVTAGERFGLIRFGSRLDIFLPAGTKVKVREGQLAIAGETVLAELN